MLVVKYYCFNLREIDRKKALIESPSGWVLISTYLRTTVRVLDILKTVRGNNAFTTTFFKEYSISFLMTLHLRLSSY